MVHQQRGGANSMACHSHHHGIGICDDPVTDNLNLNRRTMTGRAYLHRSRSKTVSTTPCENNRNEPLDPTVVDNCRINKRKCNQVRLCSQSNIPRLEYSELRSTQASHTLNEADHLNGNSVLSNTNTCTDSTRLGNISSRLIGRNRSRTTTIKCGQSPQQTSSKVINNNLIVTNPSMKRGKRTLSSTQIEREKSDEKNIKVLKKHTVLRSLSPLLLATGSRTKRTASNTK